MNEEEKKIIEKFVEKCNKFDESVEIKGVSVGEEYRILETVCKALDLVEKLQKENESLKQEITVLQNTKDTCPEFNSSGVRCNLKQENEELKGLIAHKNGYTKKLEEDLFENCSNYVVSVQKIKDKIEKEKLPLVIIGGRKNKKTLEYGIKLGRRQALRELIEEREDK